MKKITARENYEAIATFIKENGGDEAWVTFIDAQVAKIDKRNEYTKAKRAEKKANAEPDALTEAIKAVLTGEPKTIDEILAAVDFEDVTKNKISARVGKIEGVVKDKVKVEVDGKKVDRTVYSI